uniref:MD-2-related lipid-recognition domain-containing protein n=1 Tax=Lutzomyia longipalpis TaxID=7200 RepID=A0A1B0CC76_LUTLO
MLYFYEDGVKKGELPVNIDIRKGCKYIVSHTCPLRKGNVITWALDWDFFPSEIYRVGSTYKAEIVLHDEFQEHVTCLKVNLLVVP